MVLTEKDRNIIKKILYVVEVRDKRENKLTELGITCNFKEDEILNNLILDIIGFPPDNSLEFDFDVLNGAEKTETKLRVDFDNMFCRDWINEVIYNYILNESEFKDDDELIDFLYNEYVNLEK